MAGAMNAPQTGRCLCGAIRYSAVLKRAEDGAVSADICHCGQCRRWHGGPALGVEIEGDLTLEGEENLGLFQASEWAERGFCKACGSSLFWRLREGGYANIAAGTLDDQSPLRLETEIFVDDQPNFYAFEGARKRMTGAEVVALFTGAPPSDPR